jgi:hypothetical protein
MVDQRAKNQFLTSFDGEIWYPWLYDNDTCFGINNEGFYRYFYYSEDSGQNSMEGQTHVYNGYDSVLWNNFSEAFSEDIQKTYSTWRSGEKPLLSYESFIENFIVSLSEKYSISIFNEDQEFKYISLYRNDKVNIINLLDCSVVTRLKYDADDIANILLDGDKLHVQIGNVIPYQGEETGFIDVISLLTGEIETIYSYKIELPYVYLGMECIDEQYIYLEKSGYDNEDGTPSGEYIRISKDGESEEIIFKQGER